LKQLFFPIKFAMGHYVAFQKLFHEEKPNDDWNM